MILYYCQKEGTVRASIIASVVIALFVFLPSLVMGQYTALGSDHVILFGWIMLRKFKGQKMAFDAIFTSKNRV